MPTSDWVPAVAAVGAILRARTRDTNGAELGTFTADTRPNADQVTSLCETAAGDLATAISSELPPVLWAQASSLAAYKAGMLVELSYFPEQVAAGRSPYAQLRELFLDGLKDLRLAAEAAGVDVSGEAAPGADTPPPDYAFPTGMIDLDYLLQVPSTRSPWSGGLYQ